jgi:putative transposase
MSDYRRWFVAGGSFFFTVVVNGRRRLFDDARAVAILGKVLRDCHARWPVTVNAIVLLPDHLHTIWTMPPGDAEYPKRWGWIKKEFTKAWLTDTVDQAVPDNRERAISSSRRRERRRGVWQPRYWEHTLKDENDFERHLDYIHWNPVKHSHSHCPHEWPHSSFHRYVEHGVYDHHWGCFTEPPPAAFQFHDIRYTTGE